MKFILEYKSFYKVDDIILIEYWYNHMVTPVKILEKRGNKYLISHNVSESKIKNAPDESIKVSNIISIYRPLSKNTISS
jgi:hypothetical protein